MQFFLVVSLHQEGLLSGITGRSWRWFRAEPTFSGLDAHSLLKYFNLSTQNSLPLGMYFAAATVDFAWISWFQ
jgi:hypothetical protein